MSTASSKKPATLEDLVRERDRGLVARFARHYLRVLDAGRGGAVRAEPFDAIEISISELLGDD